MSKENEIYLNAVEAAAYLGVIRQRVYELARAGRLGQQVAGYWVFSKAELDKYKQEREQKPRGRPRKEIVSKPDQE